MTTPARSSLPRLRRLIAFIISAQIGFSPLAMADSGPDYRQMQDDAHMAYWAKMDLESPWLTEVALGEPLFEGKTWDIAANDPILDADPFFMRSQSWGQRQLPCADHACFEKTKSGVSFTTADSNLALVLKQRMSPVLETENYFILTADDDQIFRAKNPGEANPGEGVFFINKDDVMIGSKQKTPVPVFFFALPDEGWTGKMSGTQEIPILNQIVLHNKNGFALPIDVSDFQAIEKRSRDNMILAQSFTFLEGKLDERGYPYPMPAATIAFGSILSGKLPNGASNQASLPGLKNSFGNLAEKIAHLLTPSAQAVIKPPGILERMRMGIGERVKTLDKEYWKRWIAPIVGYGAAFGFGAYIYQSHPIDWSKLYSADVPRQLTHIGTLMGSVLVASVLLKYTIHKTKFDVKYPKVENESWLSRINKEHKGILDELAHMMYFSLAVTPQTIRHCLEFLKDSYMPSNKLLHKSWEATMGYQMRQNSHLAMNWKTFYYGVLVFGMSDALLTSVHLLLYTPYLMDAFGWTYVAGAAGAAYTSSTVIQQFLGYLQSGAHNYSADVKMIHMKSAEDEAKRQVRLQGLDPEASRNRPAIDQIMEKELEKRFKAVGLPMADEFLFDPLSVTEWLVSKSGFSAPQIASMTDEQRAYLAKQSFVLKRRRWGLVRPSLKKALETARQMQKESPSPTGEKVIQLLEWASDERSSVKAVAGSVGDLIAYPAARDELQEAVKAEVEKAKSEGNTANVVQTIAAVTKGTFKYLAIEPTQKVRDIRGVIFMMSTTGSLKDVLPLLPQSWRDQAGSEDAAIVGAELVNRAFFRYYEQKPDLVAPSAKLVGEYGARAEKILQRMARTDTSLQDAFVFKFRYRQLIATLKDKDDARNEVAKYQPPVPKGMAARQWNQARARAAEYLKPMSEEDVVRWDPVATAFQDDLGVEVEKAKWSEIYRYRIAVAREYANTVGLVINDGPDSDLVRNSLVKAAADTETQLGEPKEIAYAKGLAEPDRRFHEAQVFTEHFVTTLVQATQDAERFSARSPEFPGVGQKIRRSLVGVRGGKAISGVVRGFESMFRSEAESYKPGYWRFLERSTPILPDIYLNTIRFARVLPYGLTLSWATLYFVWKIHIPWILWATGFVTAGIHPSLVEFNNRLQRQFDIRPMDDVPSKLKYSFVHSHLTNPLAMLESAYAQQINEGVMAVAAGAGGAIAAVAVDGALATQHGIESAVNAISCNAIFGGAKK